MQEHDHDRRIMCFTVNVNIVRDELEERYGTAPDISSDYRPSYYYHAFSFPELPVIFRDAGGDGNSSSLMRWGLVPGYTASESDALKIREMTLNARAETLEEKPSFRSSFPSRRCLVPVNGFFEWQHSGKTKIPWYIFHPAESVISLGALYDRWSNDGGRSYMESFTIITTPANRLLSEIHNTKKRMPLIISRNQEDKWISPLSAPSLIREMMASYPDNILSAHTISPLIGNRKSDRNVPELIEPWTRPDQQSLF